ncbi:MAG: enoyl-CoA hydratase-related protein [Gemmatimonadota bacterium]|nr:enoyl-CoA hydratase-related protein [Gemmatimonadota bacterium]
MSERVKYAVGDDGVAVLTLARPEKRNALDPATIDALEKRLSEAESDEGVAVILLGAEGKDFCAGADIAHLEEMVDADREEHLADARRLGDLFLHMRRLPKPIVAAVHGNALAGGAGLAAACDLVLASDDAYLGYPEVHIGFVPAMVMTMLIRDVGEKKAFELVARGDRIEAETAREIGLVNAVFSRHTFDQDVRAYAAELAGRSSTAIALSKRLLYELDDLGFADGIARGVEVNVEARQTEDCRRGMRAFLDRRRGGPQGRE